MTGTEDQILDGANGAGDMLAAEIAAPSGDTQPALAPSEPAAPPAAPSVPPGHVPLNVLLQTRDDFGRKLSTLEARASAAERKLAEYEKRQQAVPANVPDLLLDPDALPGFVDERINSATAKVREEAQSQILATKLTFSRRAWSRELPKEDWAALNEWIGDLSPESQAWLEDQDDPYGTAWSRFDENRQTQRAHELHKLAGGKTLDELRAAWIAEERAKWEAEHGGGAQAPEPALDANPQPARAPNGQFASSPAQRRSAPSLALVTGAPAPANEAEDGDALFKRIYK